MKTQKGLSITNVERVAGFAINDRSGLISSIKGGLPFSSLLFLEETLNVSREIIGRAILISPATMNRRKRTGRFRQDESDRIVRLAWILDEATLLMGGDIKIASSWMKSPRDIFLGETPLMYSSTELGAREIEDLINRLMQGVFP